MKFSQIFLRTSKQTIVTEPASGADKFTRPFEINESATRRFRERSQVVSRPKPAKIHFQLVQDEDGYPEVDVESVWGRPGLTAHEFAIDNVPFFAREATLGDTVSVRQENGQYWFRSAIAKSKNSLIRVVFFDRSKVQAVGERLVALGCATEYLEAKNLLSVCIPENAVLMKVQAYLEEEARQGTIDYEEPILRQ
jgi:Domain of unknown function (DUF4265)